MGSLLADFMIGKLSLALGVAVLLGCSLSLSEALDRHREDQRLKVVIGEIFGALEDAGSFRGDVELERRLSPLPDVEVRIAGELEGEKQVLRITVRGQREITRDFIIPAIVNGGDFEIRSQNPARMVVRKADLEARLAPYLLLLWRHRPTVFMELEVG